MSEVGLGLLCSLNACMCQMWEQVLKVQLETRQVSVALLNPNSLIEKTHIKQLQIVTKHCEENNKGLRTEQQQRALGIVKAC
jgi:hypothetical protein